MNFSKANTRKSGRSAHRLAIASFAFALMVVHSNRPVFSADVISTWDGTTNDWTSNHWNSALFPNNGNGGLSYDAIVSGGTVTLDQDITIQKLTFSNGSMTAASNFALTVNDLLDWASGTISGTGQTIIGAAGTLTISGGVHELDATLVNNGAATWTAGDLRLHTGTFQNNGSFTANSNSTLDSTDLVGVGFTNIFNNAGTFTKQGTGTTQFRQTNSGVIFNNTGNVDVQAGTLSLAWGGTHTGDFNLAAGTTLSLNNTHSFAATSDVTGSGTLSVVGGTTTFNGQQAAVGAFAVSGGTVNFNGTSFLGGLNLSAGTLGGTGSATFASATWTGGTISGTGQTIIGAAGTLTISGGVHELDATLVNNGAATWTAGDLRLHTGTFQNNGSFTANSNSTLDSTDLVGVGFTNIFNNAGTFTKQGTGTTQFRQTNSGVIFNNTGNVDVQAGTLSLAWGGTHTGDFNLAAGTTLSLNNTHSFAATSDVTGSGTLSVVGGTTTFNGQQAAVGAFAVSGGTVNFNGTSFLGGLNLSAGTLGGTGSATFASATWTGGTISGTGQTIIGAAGTLTISGGVHELDATLVNNGAATWTAGDLRLHTGTFQNNGSFTANSNSTLDSTDLVGVGFTNIFNNAGTFTKQGTGTTQFRQTNSGVIFNNTGNVDVQAGTLSLAWGGTHTGDFSGVTGATLRLGAGGPFGNHSFAAGSDISGGLDVYFDSGTANTDNGLIATTGSLNFTGGTTTVGGTVSAGAISFTGGTGNFNNATTANTLTLSSGTLGGTGSATFASATWASGTISGTGQTIIGAAGTLTISGGVHELDATLVNNGAATWTAGDLRLHTGTFQNNGSFTANSNSTLDSTDLVGVGFTNIFNNAGTFTKQGTGTTQFRQTNSGVIFNNTGNVDVQAGTLSLAWGGTHTGDFNLAAGTTLSLNNTHSFAATSDVTGSGTLSVVGGTTTFNGQQAAVGAFAVSGGTVNFNGTSFLGGLNLSAGTLGGTGSATFASATWTGGTISGTGQTIIGAAGTLTISGGVHELDATLVNNGAATWTAGDLRLHTGTFQNNGSFTANSNSTLDSTDLVGVGFTNIFNNAGTFTKQGTGTTQFRQTNSGVIFNNTGNVDVQAGTLSLAWGGTHTGDFNLAAGTTLSLNNTHSFAATSDVTGSGTLSVVGGTTTFNGQLSATGTLAITGGTLNVNSTTTSGALNVTGGTATFNNVLTTAGGIMSGGTLTGSGNWNISSTYNWNWVGSNSIMSGSGQTIVTNGATLSLNGVGNTNRFYQLNRTLVNNGSITWGDGTNAVDMQMNNGTIQNYGTFTVGFSQPGELWTTGVTGTNVFNNYGTYTKQGTSPHRFRSNAVFNNYGLVHVEQGTLSLEGGGSGSGQFIVNPGATLKFVGVGFNYTGGFTLSSGTLQLTTYTLQAGAVQGSGTIAATSFTNASEVSPGITGGTEVGAIAINGIYVQSTAGSLTMDLQGTTAGQYDTLSITGTAQLGGTLEIDASNLTTVAPGTLFPIVTASSITGGFDTVMSTANDNVYFAAKTIGTTAYAEYLDRGDMNGDAIIDNHDFDLFAYGLMTGGLENSKANFFEKCECFIAPQTGGDFSGNGRLDFDDIAGFQGQLGRMGFSSAGLALALERYLSPVPEPASAPLLLAGSFYLVISRRRPSSAAISGKTVPLLGLLG